MHACTVDQRRDTVSEHQVAMVLQLFVDVHMVCAGRGGSERGQDAETDN